MPGIAKHKFKQYDMDSLILRYFELFENYNRLQTHLTEQAGLAFIKLSRARYNGTSITPESFRPSFKVFLSLKHLAPEDYGGAAHIVQSGTSTELQTKSAARNALATDEKFCVLETDQRIDSAVRPIMDEVIEKLNSTSIIDEYQVLPREQSADDAISKKAEYLRLVLQKSSVKKDDPIRAIEIMPSAATKETQAAFTKMIKTSIQLADIFVELKFVTHAIESQQTLRLQDSSVGVESTVPDEDIQRESSIGEEVSS